MQNPVKDMISEVSLPTSKEKYQRERISHWDKVANSNVASIFNSYYHKRLEKILSFHIPQGSSVLDIGCGNGNLLASLKPSYGVGIDFSPRMLDLARVEHPELIFHCLDVCGEKFILGEEKFDFIIFSDVLNDLWDVQAALQKVNHYCYPGTRIIFNFYSRLWQLPLLIAQKFRLARSFLMQNWLTREDLVNILRLSDFESIKSWEEFLLPAPIPFVSNIFNQFLCKFWPFDKLALANFVVARPVKQLDDNKYTVSVIVPARNESGNIEDIFRRTPEMGNGTELIFVEGNSTDNTYQVIEEMIDRYPERNAYLLRQDGKGKGDAVRKGFDNAHGDIFMILDADLTVPPEDLPRFFDAISSNKGEFINGVRLVYPMEKEAMRFFNFLGNKFFSIVFSWLLGQSVKDTLCGTKVLWKKDYESIVKNRTYFGDFDPFGDFDLLFGAARLGLKIVDMPIRYRERIYGTTNIQRWKHGWLLIKMVLFAASRIKFV